MKIMFHVFRVLLPGFSQNFFLVLDLLQGGKTRNFFQVPEASLRVYRGSSEFFAVQEAVQRPESQSLYRKKLGIFPSPRAYVGRKAKPGFI